VDFIGRLGKDWEDWSDRCMGPGDELCLSSSPKIVPIFGHISSPVGVDTSRLGWTHAGTRFGDDRGSPWFDQDGCSPFTNRHLMLTSTVYWAGTGEGVVVGLGDPSSSWTRAPCH
jgi:hypothetical protein